MGWYRAETTAWLIATLLGLVAIGGYAYFSYPQQTSVAQNLIARPAPPEPVPEPAAQKPVPEPAAPKPVPQPAAPKPVPQPAPPEPVPQPAAPKPVPQPAPPEPAKPLRGDVLVLVLENNASRMGDQQFCKQIRELCADLRSDSRLLGDTAFVLNRKVKIPWQEGLASAKKEDLFSTLEYPSTFAKACQTVEATRRHAENKQFFTLLIWESDINPDDLRKPPLVPPDSRVFLCYWITGSLVESEHLRSEDWFADRAAYLRHSANLRRFSLELLKARKLLDNR